jgi:hypothetical protein
VPICALENYLKVNRPGIWQVFFNLCILFVALPHQGVLMAQVNIHSNFNTIGLSGKFPGRDDVSVYFNDAPVHPMRYNPETGEHVTTIFLPENSKGVVNLVQGNFRKRIPDVGTRVTARHRRRGTIYYVSPLGEGKLSTDPDRPASLDSTLEELSRRPLKDVEVRLAPGIYYDVGDYKFQYRVEGFSLTAASAKNTIVTGERRPDSVSPIQWKSLGRGLWSCTTFDDQKIGRFNRQLIKRKLIKDRFVIERIPHAGFAKSLNDVENANAPYAWWNTYDKSNRQSELVYLKLPPSENPNEFDFVRHGKESFLTIANCRDVWFEGFAVQFYGATKTFGEFNQCRGIVLTANRPADEIKNVVVRDCIFRCTLRPAILCAKNKNVEASVAINDVLVEGCVFQDALNSTAIREYLKVNRERAGFEGATTFSVVSPSQGVVVRNCQFLGGHADIVSLFHCRDLDFHDNYIQSNEDEGLGIVGDARNVRFWNNILADAGVGAFDMNSITGPVWYINNAVFTSSRFEHDDPVSTVSSQKYNYSDGNSTIKIGQHYFYNNTSYASGGIGGRNSAWATPGNGVAANFVHTDTVGRNNIWTSANLAIWNTRRSSKLGQHDQLDFDFDQIFTFAARNKKVFFHNGKADSELGPFNATVEGFRRWVDFSGYENNGYWADPELKGIYATRRGMGVLIPGVTNNPVFTNHLGLPGLSKLTGSDLGWNW